MEIFPGIKIIDAALYFRKEKALVISDLHLGYEEALHRRGVLVPKFQLAEIIKSLQKILEKVKPKVVVINGDLKHEFGTILKQEWKDVLFLLDFILSQGMQAVIIRGNHDPLTKAVAEKRGVQVIKEYLIGDTLVVHGDELIEAQPTIKRLLIGHVHPAITLREGSKYEKYKCFLKGEWKSRWKQKGKNEERGKGKGKEKGRKKGREKELIVLPSFNPLLEGTDIRKEELSNPFLRTINNYQVYIIHSGKVFDFGRLSEIKLWKTLGKVNQKIMP